MLATRSSVASVADLLGRPACDGGGEVLGRVEDLVLDIDADRVAYVLLSFGGFIRGDRLFAVPVRLLSLDPGDSAVTVHVDRTMLKNAPVLAANDRETLADRRWGMGVYAYYGYTPYWE